VISTLKIAPGTPTFRKNILLFVFLFQAYILSPESRCAASILFDEPICAMTCGQLGFEGGKQRTSIVTVTSKGQLYIHSNLPLAKGVDTSNNIYLISKGKR